jgi:hypothetical protein
MPIKKLIKFYTGKGGVVFPVRTSLKGGYKPKLVKEKTKYAKVPKKRNKRMSRVAKRK